MAKNNQLNIENFLQKAKKISGKQSYVCPICGNGSGKDKTGITEDPKRKGKYHCFKCNFDGDIYDIIDIVENREKGESYKIYNKHEYIYENEEANEIKKYIESCCLYFNNSNGKSYMKERGFNDETLLKYKIGYDPNYRQIVIPYPNKNYYIRRSIDEKIYFKIPSSVAGNEPLFNEAALNKEIVYITEGQIDALSIIQAGGNAIATGGVGNHSKIEFKGNYKPKIIYIVADNDDAGKRNAEALKKHINTYKINTYILYPPKKYKDANEFMIKDKDLFYNLIKNDSWLSYQYRMNKSAMNFVDDIVMGDSIKPIKSGFNKLDNEFGGGFYPGLYIIGAISSLGKTTFCLQIADYIANNYDVLIFSLEMGKKELIAKSLSRISHEETPNSRKTMREIMNERNCIDQKVIDKYKTFSRNIFIEEMDSSPKISNIETKIKEHIKITKKIPFIIIDYLQILSGDSGKTDKQIADNNIYEIKKICRKYNCTMLVISSLNRASYEDELRMSSFKESGAIEYSSDVLFGLQLSGTNKESDIDIKKSKDLRHIELKILKNRNGKTGGKIKYQYYTPYNIFHEE